MRKAPMLAAVIAVPLILGGCAAAIVPMLAAEAGVVGYSGYKLVQTTTGGSLEIAVDVSKVTSEQKAQIKSIKSIAVWPEKDGGSVTFAQALSEGGRFSVVSPARVANALKKMELPDDLKLMTAAETKSAFSKVCQTTGADAIISTKATGSNTTMNTWSLERANITMQYVASIYAKHADATIVEIPIALKVLVGEKRPPSNEEISNLANAEMAKNILALAMDQSTPEPVASRSRP